MAGQISIVKKLNILENEINNLKTALLKISQSKKQSDILKLEGALSGVSVTEEDMNKAKKSLFKLSA